MPIFNFNYPSKTQFSRMCSSHNCHLCQLICKVPKKYFFSVAVGKFLESWDLADAATNSPFLLPVACGGSLGTG